MNIKKANTEPFYRFHRFNEEFSRNMRLSVGALGLVAKMGANAPTKLNPIQLPTEGEPWGKQTNWRTVANAIPVAKRFLSQMGTVRVLSAFEDLLIGVKAEFDRHSQFRGKGDAKGVSDGDDCDALGLTKLYSQLGWDTSQLNASLPLYEYFVLVRNCVVHRSGRANNAPSAYARDPDLAVCIKRWHLPTEKRLPPLPAICVGEEIALLPRHAILTSIVCYRIALDINMRLRGTLGKESLVLMAAFHSLLSKDPIETNATASADAIINLALTGRYRISLDSQSEAATILSSMGKWKACLKAFQRLRPQP